MIKYARLGLVDPDISILICAEPFVSSINFDPAKV
jgi:hypothetical protein